LRPGDVAQGDGADRRQPPSLQKPAAGKVVFDQTAGSSNGLT